MVMEMNIVTCADWAGAGEMLAGRHKQRLVRPAEMNGQPTVPTQEVGPCFCKTDILLCSFSSSSFFSEACGIFDQTSATLVSFAELSVPDRAKSPYFDETLGRDSRIASFVRTACDPLKRWEKRQFLTI